MAHLTDPALDAIDRGVRRAAEGTVAWHERLALKTLGEAIEDQPPLAQHRAVAGKLAYDGLAAREVMASESAWRIALLRWIGALAVLRVTEEPRLEEARVVTEPLARVRLETVHLVSFRAAWDGLVGSKNAAEGAAWLAALSERGPAVAAARRERAAREEEAVRRLGFGTFAEIVGVEPDPVIEQAARTFLTRTADLARAVRRDAARRGEQATSFVSVILAANARDAPEGWPARLTLRALVETLRAPHDIGRGLRVRVRLPPSQGAASFARGLEAFGEAYRRAAAHASKLPFALAVDPCFVDAHRFGYAFGALATQPAYLRQGLGVAAGVARDQARALACSALVHARHTAMAALLARHAARPDPREFEELTAEVFGESAPAPLSGAFPRPLGPGDAHARVAALLTTLPFLELLRDRFEEDWFRNPRAWEYLRGRAAGPARHLDDADGRDARPGPEALARAFEAALG